ncbi:hypothetical protein [Streptomyces sp. NPDC018000]|uniref:hypothetical protein n=1 Tax=Streptomyces sp. NPDC018000 TaxID=3365028 RepID=UPI003794F4E4
MSGSIQVQSRSGTDPHGPVDGDRRRRRLPGRRPTASTPTLRRRVIRDKDGELIDALYGEDGRD